MNVSVRILKVIRCDTFNQCSCIKTGDMCSCHGVQVQHSVYVVVVQVVAEIVLHTEHYNSPISTVQAPEQGVVLQ